MTTFEYNGINFGYVKTANIGHVAVRDPSDTDLLHTKFTIHIQSVVAITPQTPNFQNIGSDGPAKTLVKIRHMLMSPRRPMTLATGHKTILQINANGRPLIGGQRAVEGLDDANGPKPQSLNVHHISDHCYEIDYVVEVCLKDCEPDDPQESVLKSAASKLSSGSLNQIKKADWASFRYSTSQDIDEHGMSTITMSGKLITRTSLLAKGGPDSLRAAITPPPIPGFRRRSHYEVQADGLGLNFSFTDTELYISPPPGTSEARGTHTISTNMGGKWTIDVSLTLMARKEKDKRDIMEMAVAIVLDRIRRSGAENVKGTNQVQIMKCTIQEEMYGPSVSVSMQAFTSGPRATIQNKKNTASWVKLGLQLAPLISPATGIFFGNQLGGSSIGATIGELFDKDIKAEQQKATPQIIDTFNFGGDPLGSSKSNPILHDFGTRGYTPWLHLLAATFNDPCLSAIVAAQSPTDNRLKNASPLPGVLKGVEEALKANRLISGTSSNLQRNGDESKISVVNDVEVFDFQASIYDASTFVDGSGIWDTYLCKFKSHRDTGYRGFPAMQDGGGTAFIKLHDDTMKLTVSWIAKKMGAPPEIPSPDSTDDNLVLIDVVEGRDDVKELADGQSVEYTVSGEYIYGIKDWETYNARWPVPPWLDLDQNKLRSIGYFDEVSGESETATNAESQVVTVGA